jgi:hypothetical protein
MINVGSGMIAERGHDVVLAMDDEDEDDKGERGEPALLPISQLVVDDER